jgi:mRNA interferase MazF
VQNDFFNRTSLKTTIVCTLTENLRRGSAPGNVLLHPGESGLRGQSVILVSQIVAIDKGQLGEYIGTLNDERIQEVISGIKLLIEPRVY